MKKLLLLLASAALLTGCGSAVVQTSDEETNGEIVYICTGHMSECYHEDPDCRGLIRCSRDIEEITIEEAEEMGRRPCSFCYR